MKMNWAYNTPRFLFDEAATGTGDVAPAAAPVTPAAPSGTPAAAPASSPPSEAAPSPAEPSAGASAAQSADPFGGLDDDFDAIVVDDAPPTAGGATPPQATPPAAPPPAAASPAPAATPPAAPVQPNATPAPSATSPASPGERLNEAVEGFKANSGDLSKWAGQNLFKLSPEDAVALTTNAEEVIPRLMGQVYTQAMIAAGNLMRNFIPQMVEHGVGQHTSRSERSREAMQAFFSANTDLNAKDHGDSIARWAKAFRTANPSASRQEAIEYVANAVRLQHKMPMPGATPAPRAPQPFAPARPGGRTPPPPATHDPFAGLDQDFDE